MGRPTKYSSELPQRCQALIDRYCAQIGNDVDPNDDFDGPLKTTFLLAMATPMVVLPLERIFKPAVWGEAGVADDVALDEGLSDRVKQVFGDNRPFGEAPFFREGVWTYVAACRRFEVGRNWPDERLLELASQDARAAALNAPASEILSVIRNGLAHGGVTYLDGDGHQAQRATEMLGFASFVSRRDKTRLRLLRIGVSDFQEFLGLWTSWLLDSGAADALAAGGPGHFYLAAE